MSVASPDFRFPRSTKRKLFLPEGLKLSADGPMSTFDFLNIEIFSTCLRATVDGQNPGTLGRGFHPSQLRRIWAIVWPDGLRAKAVGL